jgi:hypothetical protein
MGKSPQFGPSVDPEPSELFQEFYFYPLFLHIQDGVLASPHPS